jgi:hypothetical protein
LIVDMGRFPVAMVFGQVGGLIFGNPIQDVLTFLDMTIDGDGDTTTSPPGKQGRSRPNSP